MKQTISFPESIPVSVKTPCRAAALLVDGENLPSRLSGRLMVEARRALGPLAVLRVYGNAGLLNGWAEAPGFRLIHAHSGKNIADMLLTVEAMELSYAGQVDGFAVATCDRDFAPLAWSLRSRGFPAVLLASEKAPQQLRHAFTGHVEITGERTLALQATEPPPGTSLEIKVQDLVLSVLGGRTMLLPAFAAQMKEHGYTKPSGTNWRKHLETLGAPIALDGEGHGLTIRLQAGAVNRGS